MNSFCHNRSGLPPQKVRIVKPASPAQLRTGPPGQPASPPASAPAADLVTNNMLLGTVMHTLFDIPNLRLRNNLPAEVQRVITNAQPIKQLV